MPADRDRPDEDLDAAFAAIIAGWDDIPSMDADTEPTSDGVGTDDGGDTDTANRPGTGDARHAPPGEPPRAGRWTNPPQRRANDGADASGSPDPSPPLSTPPSLPASGPRDWAAREDPDDDRFHPPDPPPLPRGDLVGRLAWAGVLLGPAFLLCAGLFWRGAPRLWLALAVLAFVGGFVTLVLRLPADRDDSDGDDGAVV
jgi:hypothetical protein